MPINCLVKCLFNFWTVMFQKTIHGQFVKNSWTFMFQKNGPFASSSPFLSLPLLVSLSFCLFVSLSLCLFLSFPLSSSLVLSRPLFLSFFNVHSANPANSLKTKDLKKRHFRLKILRPGKPLIIKTLGAKFTQYLSHFPADPTLPTPPKLNLHAPPRNPTSCKVLCRICRPNPTHPTPLIIKS